MSKKIEVTEKVAPKQKIKESDIIRLGDLYQCRQDGYTRIFRTREELLKWVEKNG